MAAAPTRGIPRLIYLGRVVYLCFFPVLTVVLGNFALLTVPQAREALLAFEHQGWDWQGLLFVLAFFMWMVSAWYVARLLVGRRFHPDLIGVCHSAPFARKVALRLPRILGMIAGLPIAIYLTATDAQWRLGLVLLIVSILTLLGIVLRRSIARRRGAQWVHTWQAGNQRQQFATLGTASRWLIGGALALSLVILVLLPTVMEPVARVIGSPALLLFALMSWTVTGGFVLTYLPKSRHRTAITWLPALAFVAFAPLNENHPVAPQRASAELIEAAASRPTIAVHFQRWLQQRKKSDEPIVFIAVAGGASRASYWTASTLGLLADQIPAFADNVFLISSISGGSLGAAAFVTAIDVKHSHSDCAVRDLTRDFTGRDHLSSVVGMMLFPDLVQRFNFFPWDALDRSRGLENVWVRDWPRTLGVCGIDPQTARNHWNEPFLSLRPEKDAPWLPTLALNTTALQAGRIVLQAGFTSSRIDTFDIFASDLATESLTLSQAVHNSARFPYVSPGGVVRTRDGRIWDRLGDGGYVEASGTLVLGQLIRELVEAGMIREAGAPQCGQASENMSCFALQSQIKVLVVDNAPVDDTAWLCIAPPYRSAPTQMPRNLIEPAPEQPLPDVLVPLTGAFSTRGGRAVSADVDLLHLVGGCDSGRYAELRYPRSATHAEPSMNWMLNEQSRRQMDCALDHDVDDTPAHRLLHQNLAQVHTWFGVAAPAHKEGCRRTGRPSAASARMRRSGR